MYLGSGNIFGLIAPYEIVNSINLDENHPNQSNLISKYDFDEDEFTGDSVPVLDNSGLIDQYPNIPAKYFKKN